MRGRRLTALTLNAAVLLACGDPLEPIAPDAPRLLVHAVMDLGANRQLVLIERTGAAGSTGGAPIRAVRGASVTVQVAGFTFTAVEDPPGASNRDVATYRIPLSRGSFAGFGPNARIDLRIATAEGDTITGTTTMPAAFPVGAPTFVPTFNRDRDTLRLAWPRVPGARGYQVSIYALLSSADGDEEVVSSYSAFADTSIVVPGGAWSIENGDHAFPRNRRVTVVVAAVDDNYHTYYRPKVDPFAGTPPSRLTGGAIGVLGSIVPVLVRRYDVQ